MAEQFVDYSLITLAQAVGIGDTSIVVSSASRLPATGTFRLQIDQEIMLVTGVSGTTLTVTRGTEGTAAATHAVGAQVTPGLTAAALAQLKADIIAAGLTPVQIQQQIAASYIYATENFVQGSDLAQAQTTIASGSNGASLSAATINVLSTTGFKTSGTLTVQTTTGFWEVQYLAKTATSFTGCLSLGTGTMATGGTVTQSALWVPGPWNRLFNAGLLFGVHGGRVWLESVQQMSEALIELGITGSLGIPGCNMLYWDETQVDWAFPSATGYYGAHVFVQGSGAAGIIQSLTPNGVLIPKWFIGAAHGTCELSNLTFTGDPNAPISATTGPYMIPFDATYMVYIGGNTWNVQLRDLEFYSFSCTTAVLAVDGLTGPNIYNRLHFSGCGVAANTSTPTNVGAAGVWYLRGAENGHHGVGATWLIRQLPLYQLPSREWGYSPGLYIDEGEAPGTNTGTGNSFSHLWFGSTLGCAICVNPSGGAGSTASMLTLKHCYFATNCANALYAGAVHLDHNVLSFKMEDCTDFRNNQATFPLLGFNGAGIGPCEVLENQTPMWATTTVLPNVTGGKPLRLTEKWHGIEAEYFTDSGSGFLVNQTIVIGGNDGGTIRPTVSTAPITAVAQDVIGVAMATTAAHGYGPIAHLNQPGLTVINDSAASLLNPGARVSPSTATAGAVMAASSPTNSIGRVTQQIAATAGATGNIM